MRVASLHRDTQLPDGTLHQRRATQISATLRWEGTPDGLAIQMPETRPSDEAMVIKLTNRRP